MRTAQWRPLIPILKRCKMLKKKKIVFSLSLRLFVVQPAAHVYFSLSQSRVLLYRDNMLVKISFHGSEKVVRHILNLRCSFLYAWMDSFGVQGVPSASQRLIFWAAYNFFQKSNRMGRLCKQLPETRV